MPKDCHETSSYIQTNQYKTPPRDVGNNTCKTTDPPSNGLIFSSDRRAPCSPRVESTDSSII